MTALVMTTVVLAANVLGAGMAYPQARKLVRTRRADGVSTVWVGISMAMNAWWVVYGLVAEVWALIPVSGVSFLLYATIAYFMLRTVGGSALRGIVLGLFGLGVLPVVFLLAGGWELAGTVIGLGYGIQLAPAVIGAYRSVDLGGVAAGTWVIALVEAVLWLLYGSYMADPALLAGGVSGTAMSVLILGRLAWTGHQPFRGAWVPA
jgi:uncharacterized protein with PQ loop repeat